MTTDNLRAIANDLDELGEELDDFVLLAGVRGEPNKFWAREGGHELGTPFEREVGR